MIDEVVLAQNYFTLHVTDSFLFSLQASTSLLIQKCKVQNVPD